MADCIHEFLIQNGEVKKCHDFHNNLIYSDINVYEVIRVINGVPLFCEKHLERMKKSMELIHMDFPYSYDFCKENIIKLIGANNKIDGNIKLVINADKPKKDFMLFYINHHYPEAELYEEGVKTILYHGERDNPNAKIVNDDFREKINESIKKANAYEAILVDRKGRITEGSRSNIFFVKGDKVITSPLADVLPGITREEILRLCTENKIKVVEEGYSYEEIKFLDGAFISGTSPRVLPISYIDEKALNSPQNPIIKIIINKYQERMQNYINCWT
ncbi:aminotransferase class IV [Clostridium amazonitimonense]|uniref:aminotransferase class IV n=1 Tax=Clostridium amazonitimonense TaxID=1499689 RepID=UPI000509C3FB|nr:aminotransferase class IV [Clostridium amazonitimonense]